MLIALNITIVLIGLILGSYLSRTVMKLLPRDVDFELQTARYKLYLQDEQEIEATQVESESRSHYSEQEWPALSRRLKSHLSELPLSRPLHSFGLKHFIRSMLFLAFFVSWVLLAYFIYKSIPIDTYHTRFMVALLYSMAIPLVVVLLKKSHERAQVAFSDSDYGSAFESKCAPILYLRSFAADQQKNIMGTRFDDKNPEEVLIGFLKSVAPVIAVGSPTGPRLVRGAARVFVDDASWKSSVKTLMEISNLIVIKVDGTPGTVWEIDEALEMVGRKNLLFVLVDNLGYPVCKADYEIIAGYLKRHANLVLPNSAWNSWAVLVTKDLYVKTFRSDYISFKNEWHLGNYLPVTAAISFYRFSKQLRDEIIRILGFGYDNDSGNGWLDSLIVYSRLIKHSSSPLLIVTTYLSLAVGIALQTMLFAKLLLPSLWGVELGKP